MPTMTRTAEVKTRTTAQIKADAAAVYARWGIACRTRSTSSSPSRLRLAASPSTCAPRLPRLTDLSATPITPAWMRMESRGFLETGMTASDGALSTLTR